MSKLTPEQKKSLKLYKDRIKKMMKGYGKTSEHGLTEVELRKYFGDRIMTIFGNWIDGQTCMLTDDGVAIIYPEDIDRFLGMLIYRTPTYWD